MPPEKGIGNLWNIFQIFPFNEKIENDSERNLNYFLETTIDSKSTNNYCET